MTSRDRTILVVVALVGVVGVFWFLALSPKLKDLSAAREDVSEARAAYEQARTESQQFAQARIQFPRAYASLARLGKSVPATTDEASLIYQVDRAAARAGVNFEVLELDAGTGAEEQGAAAPPPAAPGAQPASGGGAAPAAGAAPPAPAAPATPTGPPSGTLGSSPADATVTAVLTTGSPTGAAGMRVMHFDFEFTGPFFRLEDFLRIIKRQTWTRHDRLLVSGRLMTIDALSFSGKGNEVSIRATAYLLPTSQGLFAGATPAGPAGVGEAAPQATAGGAPAGTPPTAAVTP